MKHNEYFLGVGISCIIGVIFYGLNLISESNIILGILTALIIICTGIISLLIYYFEISFEFLTHRIQSFLKINGTYYLIILGLFILLGIFIYLRLNTEISKLEIITYLDNFILIIINILITIYLIDLLINKKEEKKWHNVNKIFSNSLYPLIDVYIENLLSFLDIKEVIKDPQRITKDGLEYFNPKYFKESHKASLKTLKNIKSKKDEELFKLLSNKTITEYKKLIKGNEFFLNELKELEKITFNYSPELLQYYVPLKQNISKNINIYRMIIKLIKSKDNDALELLIKNEIINIKDNCFYLLKLKNKLKFLQDSLPF